MQELAQRDICIISRQPAAGRAGVAVRIARVARRRRRGRGRQGGAGRAPAAGAARGGRAGGGPARTARAARQARLVHKRDAERAAAQQARLQLGAGQAGALHQDARARRLLRCGARLQSHADAGAQPRACDSTVTSSQVDAAVGTSVHAAGHPCMACWRALYGSTQCRASPAAQSAAARIGLCLHQTQRPSAGTLCGGLRRAQRREQALHPNPNPVRTRNRRSTRRQSSRRCWR